jgi:ketosteroid isomerase-like protein
MLERLVARNFRALDRKDLRTFMRGWADDAVFEFPGHSAISGRFVGKSAIEAWWRRWFARMQAVHFAVKRVGLANPFTLSIVNTVFVEWTADVTTKDGLSAHAEAVSVMCIRRGKVWLARDYFLDPAVEDQVWGRRSDGDVAGSAPEEPPIPVGAPRTDRTAEPAVVS